MQNPSISASSKLIKIGPAAKILGVSIDTLRRWEKAGKLESIRTPGGTRLYSVSHLKQIKSGKSENLNIRESDVTSDVPTLRSSDTPFVREPGFTARGDGVRAPGAAPAANTWSEDGRRETKPAGPRTNYSEYVSPSLNKPSNPNPIYQTTSIVTPEEANFLGQNTPSILSQISQLPLTTHLVAILLMGALALGILGATHPQDTKIFGRKIASAFTGSSLTKDLEGTILAGVVQTKSQPVKEETLSPSANQELAQGLSNALLPSVLAATDTAHFLEINADTKVLGTFEVDEDSKFNSALSVAGPVDLASTLIVTGATTVDDTLTVKGDTNLSNLIASGQIKLTGNAADTLIIQPSSDPAAATKLFTIKKADGTEVASLDSTGNLNLAGNGVIKGTLNVSGTTTTLGALTASTITSTDLATLASLKVTGTTNLAGAATLDSTLKVSGATTLSSTLAVSGATTLSSTLDVTGAATFASTINTNTLTATSLAFSGSNPIISSNNNQIFLKGGVGIGYTNSTAPSLPPLGLAVAGNLGIGTTSPGATLAVAGTALFGMGYQGYSPPPNGMLIQGNVGISTSAPEGALDVLGTSFFRGNLSLTLGQLLLNDGSSSTPTLSFSNDSDSGLYRLSSDRVSLITGGSALNGIIINSSGNLGVGNSNSASKLGVSGNSAFGSYYSTLSAPTNGLLVEGNVGIGTTATSNATFSLGGSAIIGSSYVSTQVAPSNGLLVQGNVGIGATFTNTYTLSVGGNIGSGGHILPTAASLNIGSSGLRWSTGYFDTVDATSIAGTVTGGSTTAADWTINSDNASSDTETMSLAFERGSVTPNAVLRWDVNSKLFNLNSGLLLGSTSQDSQITTSPYGLTFSSIPFDITSGTNEHITIVPNGTGNVGIGTSGPGAYLSINGNQVIGFLGTANAPTNGLAVQGNIGIGTSTAGSNLTVVGTSNISGNATFGSQLLLANGSASLPSYSFTNLTNAGLWTNGNGLLLTTNGSATSGLTVTGAGNVGIGITAPGNTLSVNGGIDIGNWIRGSTQQNAFYADGNSAFIQQPTSGTIVFRKSDGTVFQTITNSGNLGVYGGGLFGFSNTTANPPTNGLAVSGNVGIGTTTTGFALDVVAPNIGTGARIGRAFIGTVIDNSAYMGVANQALATTVNSYALAQGIGGDTYLNSASGQSTSFSIGGTVKATLNSSGNLGVGTISPVGLFQVGSSPTPGLIVLSGGNVGIGVSNLQSYSGQAPKLEIQGTSTLYTDADGGNLVIFGNSTAAKDAGAALTLGQAYNGTTLATGSRVRSGKENSTAGNYASYLAFDTRANGGNFSEKLRIASDGNIGIGTTGPTSRLHVYDSTDGTNSRLTIDDSSTSDFPGINFSFAGTARSVMRTSADSSGADLDFFTLPSAGGSLTQRLKIDSDGNIGIGTTGPSANLSLGTNLTTKKLYLYDSSTGPYGMGVTANLFSIYTGADASTNKIAFGNHDGTNFNAWAAFVNGNLGIGTTAVGSSLQVNGNGVFGFSSATIAAPSNGLAVSGNVGIGTTTTSAKLDIRGGNLNVDTNQGIQWNGNPSSSASITWDTAGIRFTNNNVMAFRVDAGSTTIGVDAIGSSKLSVSGNGAFGTGYVSSSTPTNGLAVQGNVGIGITTANSTLSISGNTHIGSLYQSIAAPTNGLFVDGNVGIGATTSSNKLDVWGNARITGTLTLDGAFTNNGNITSGGVFLASNGTAAAPSHSFTNLTNAGLWTNGNGLLLTTGSSNTSGITITGAGNVGIGTTTPSTIFSILQNDSNAARLRLSNAVGALQNYVDSSGNSIIYSETSGKDIKFETSSGTMVIIKNDGNFGIGTQSPTSKLQISGGNVGIGVTSAISTLAVNGNSTIGWGVTGVAGPTNGLAVSGNVGVGTSTANFALEVAGLGAFNDGTASSPALTFRADSDTGIFRQGSNILSIATGGTERVTINGSGNVGIGISSNLNADLTVNDQLAIANHNYLGSFGFTSNVGMLIASNNSSATLRLATYSTDTTSDPYINFLTSGAQNWAVGTDNSDSSKFKIAMNGSFNGTNEFFTINTSGNVGIGVSTINSKLVVVGNAVVGNTYTGIVAPTSGLLVEGNVGIGATTSSNKLDVWGNARITGTLTLDGALSNSGNVTTSGVFLASDGSASAPSYSFTNDTNTGMYRQGTDILGLVTGGNERLTIDANGNVGIGATTPQANFHILKNSAIAQVETTTGNTNASFKLANSDQVWSLALRGADVSDALVLRDQTNSLDVLTVSPSSGNIGIQNNTPVQRFQINSTTSSFVVTSSGNVGIGFTSPTASLHIVNAASQDSFRVDDATNDTSPFIIDQNGNIGVGTASPTRILHLTSTTSTREGAYYNLTYSGSGVFEQIVSSPIFSGSATHVRSFYGTNPTASGGSVANVQIVYLDNASGGTTSNASLVIGGNPASGTYSIYNASSNISYFGGNIGIGLTTANSQLSVSNNVHIGSLYQGTVAPTNGLFVDGNVGIGATTSSNKLDVWGNARITGNLTVDGSQTFSGSPTFSGQILASDGTASAPGYSFSSDTNTGIFRAGTDALDFVTGGTERFTITAAGFVGIGITSPGTNLQVGSTSNFQTGSNFTGSVFGGGSRQAFTMTDGTVTVYSQIASNIGYFGTLSNHSLILQTNSTNRGIIDNGGNFGIGTISPAGLFQVGGSPTPGLIVLSGGNVGIGTTAPGASLVVNGAGMIGYSSGTPALTNGLAISGNLGIGTSAPLILAGLTASGSTQGLFIEDTDVAAGTTGRLWRLSNSDGSLSFTVSGRNGVQTTGSSEKVTIDSSGNVGIGTSAPVALGHIYNTGSGNSFRVDDATADTTPFIIDATGNIGVGTATANAKFQVYGGKSIFQAESVSQNTGTFGTPVIAIAKNSDPTSYFDGVGVKHDLMMYPGGDTSYAFMIGQGDTTSQYTASGFLQVQGPGPVGGSLMLNPGGGNVGIGLNTGASVKSKLHIKGAGTTTGLSILTQNSTQTNFGLAVQDNSLVGIGTSAPSSYLEINIGNGASGELVSTANPKMVSFTSFADPTAAGQTVSGLYVTSSTNTASFSAQNLVGINADGANFSKLASGTIPTAASIFASAPTLATRNFSLYAEGAGYFGGNVGIGTTAPTSPFHISNSSTTKTYTAQIDGRIAEEGSAGLYINPNLQPVTSAKQNVYGLYVNPTSTNNLGGADATNYMAIYASLGGAGDPTNSYGLYIDSPTVGTNKYAAAFSGGNVGIGTTNPTLGILDIAGGSGATTPALAIRHGDGRHLDFYESTGATRLWSINRLAGTNKMEINTANVNGDVVFTTGTGNVGIGTTSPQGTLDVQGVNSYFGTAGGGARINATGSGAGAGAGIWLRFTDNNAYYDSASSTIFRVNSGSSTANALTIDSGGNVGVGNFGASTPVAKLQITGSGTSTAKTLMTQNSTKTNFGLSVLDNGNVGIGTTAPGGIFSIGTSNPSLFVESTSGNVGIGTSIPTAKLHVVNATGDSAATETLRLSDAWSGQGDGPLLRFVNTHSAGTNPSPGMYNLAGISGTDDNASWGGSLVMYTAPTGGSGGNNLTERLRINANGNVGIGISNAATSILHVLNAGAGSSFRVDDATGDTSPFIIDAAGNTGIWTQTPKAALHISNGSQYLDSPAGNGSFASLNCCGFVSNVGDQFKINIGNTSDYTTTYDGLLLTRNGTNTMVGIAQALVIGTGYNSTFYSSGFYLGSGNAGIGSATLTAAAKLHVTGSSTTTAPAFLVQNSTRTNFGLTVLDNGNVGIGTTALGGALIVNGNVGIGFTSPTAKLEVRGNLDSSTNNNLVNLVPAYTANFTSYGAGVNIQATDSTTNANADYNIYSNLTLTGNAAKTGLAFYGTVTSSSTTADSLYGAQFDVTSTGAISSGNRNLYGVYSDPVSSGANSGGTTNLYGIYSLPSLSGATTGSTNNIYGGYFSNAGTLTSGGTINNYGVYVANGSTNTTGTASKYGLYIVDQTGSDTNFNIYSAGSTGINYFGGNVGIGVSAATPVGVLQVGPGSAPAAFFVGTNGNVGIGTTSPTNKLFVTASGGNDTAYFENNNNFYGINAWGGGSSGAGGYISGSAYGLTATTNNSSYGAISEAAALYAYTSVSPGQSYTNAYGLDILNSQSTGTITSNYGIKVNSQTKGSTNNYGIYIDTPSGGSGNNSALFVNGGISYFGGNVGIGTTGPSQKLHIAGNSSAVNALRMSGGSTNSNPEINLDSGTEFDGWQVRKDSSTLWAIKSVTSGNDMALFVDNTSTRGVYIKTGGNVGINNAAPTAKLHLTGAGISTGVNFLSTGSGGGGGLVGILDNGNVGIGTTTPTAGLDISSGKSARVGGVAVPTYPSAGAGLEITYDTDGWIGDTSGSTGVSYITSYSRDAGAYRDLSINANNTLITAGGSATKSLVLWNNGFVGIGIGATVPAAQLEVKATGTGIIAKFTSNNTTGCTLADGGTISCSSDERLKKNISELNYGLSDLMQLRPVLYNWRNETDDTTRSLGFIAQEVETVIPKLVTTDSDTGFKQLNTIGLVPILTKSIQELNNKVSQLSLDSQGNLIIPKITTDHLVINQDLSAPDLNSVKFTNQVTDLATTLNNLEASSSSRLAELEASTSAAIAGVQTSVASQSATLNSLTSQTASTSATLAQTKLDLVELKGDLEDIKLKLTAPESLLATGSATLEKLNVSDKVSTLNLDTFDATISGTLKALGEAHLGTTLIAGDLNVDGTLSITQGNTIDTLGTLFIQKSGLANLVDFFNGLVTIDKTGKLQAKEVTTEKLTIQNPDTLGARIGRGVLPTGQSNIFIPTTSISRNSKVFITLRSLTDKILAVTNITPDEGFNVGSLIPMTQDVEFDWWIVEESTP